MFTDNESYEYLFIVMFIYLNNRYFNNFSLNLELLQVYREFRHKHFTGFHFVWLGISILAVNLQFVQYLYKCIPLFSALVQSRSCRIIPNCQFV